MHPLTLKDKQSELVLWSKSLHIAFLAPPVENQTLSSAKGGKPSIALCLEIGV